MEEFMNRGYSVAGNTSKSSPESRHKLALRYITPPINDAKTHAVRMAHRDKSDGVLFMHLEHKRRGVSIH